jgi:nucleoside-diphosphate-sugar epimerase
MKSIIEFVSSDLDVSLQGSEHKLSMFKNKVILVTGGTGFMGSWLTTMIIYLNENYNYNVKLYLVAREMEDKITFELLKKFNYIHFFRHDIRNYFDFPQDVNYIIHAAASPDTRFHASQPLKTIETIVNGTTNVLLAATRLPYLNNIVHISSGLIYGKNDIGVYQEETSFGKLDCSQLSAAYAESKRISETIAMSYRNQFRLPLSILRPFTFIGAFQNIDKPWAFNSILREALLKQPLRILGDGQIKRGYMYGSDMAFWVLNALANAKSGSIYNIGSEEAVSLKTLASIISNKLENQPSIEIKHFQSLQNNFDWIADSKKIQNDLGVSQRIDIHTAINRTLDYYTIYH